MKIKRNDYFYSPYNVFVFINVRLFGFLKKFNMDIRGKNIVFSYFKKVLSMKSTQRGSDRMIFKSVYLDEKNSGHIAA